MFETARDRQMRGSQPNKGDAALRRIALLRSSALQAVALLALGLPTLSVGAMAQSLPAPTQLPTGGKVFSGSAGIATSGTTLNVNQASQRAGINWQSFSIGSQATVAIHTPGPQALTINRVVGPNPSVIAGRLNSNGQVVITNQSGVTFTQGAQVDVQSLIASAPGISEANARAGRLVFDQPARPGAGVANHGTITVGQTGLAALVAPQVVNSGVIRAHLGRVVLAGAAAHTVDLYGDGLLSIDVSKQVTTVPLGPDGKPVTALVTNTGTILADGGTIVLTAKAVDGLVTTLVESGGTISAPTRNGARGRIVIGGTGGDVILRGMVAARGDTAGATGGQIEVNAPGHKVTLAAGTRVDASGRAGGGVVAVGTTLARAKGGPSVSAPTAKHVTIASGATLAADATAKGNGGVVVVLSQGGATFYQGEISARGGPTGGDGGAVEVSGDYLALLGSVNVLAPMGAAGSVLLDPNNIEIVTDGTASKIALTNPYDAANPTTTLDYTQINKLSGNVILQATGSIDMTGAMDLTGKDAGNHAPHVEGLAMLANGNITIDAALTGVSGLILSAGATYVDGAGKTQAGQIGAGLTINAPVTSTGVGTVSLSAAVGGVIINSTVATGGTVSLLGLGGVTETASGQVIAATLSGIVTGDVQLTASSTNAIATLGSLTVNAGVLALADGSALTVTGPVSATDVRLSSVAAGTALQITGSVVASGTVSLETTLGTLDIASKGAVSGAAVQLNGAAGISADGTLTAGTLSGGSTSGGAVLTGAGNAVATLGAFSTKLGFSLVDGSALTVSGPVSGTDVTLSSTASGTALQITGAVVASGTASLMTTPGTLDIASTGSVSGAVVELNGAAGISAAGVLIAGTLSGGSSSSGANLIGAANQVAALGDFSTKLDFVLDDNVALSVTGAVSGRNITLATSVGALELSGTLDATGGTLDLSAAGGIAQSGGVLAAATLLSSGGAGGDVVLGEAANAIGTLAGFTVTSGSLALTDGGALAVGGVVKVDDGRTIALTADAIGFAGAGSLDAGAGVVALIPLSGAAMLTLDGTTTGDLGRITAGTISLGGAAGGGGTQAAGIAITGNLTTTAMLELHSTGTIVQSAGRLSVGSLTGNASGVSIEQAGNVIPLLGAFTVSGGDFRLVDSVALEVRGSVTGAGTVALTTAGALALAGDIAAGTLDLSSAAGITQNSGSLTAATLLSSLGVTGNVTLDSAGNAITTLGDFAVTSGGFTLADGSNLAVTGAVSGTDIMLSGTALSVTGQIAGGTVSLAATTGAIDIAATGMASGATAVVLNGATGITAAGALTAATLSGGSLTGGARLTGTNQVQALGDFDVRTALVLEDTLALTVAGTVRGADVTLSSAATGTALQITGAVSATGTASLAATAGAIGLSGTLTGLTAVVLDGAMGITGKGALIAGTLGGRSVSGGVTLDGAANQVTTLGDFSAAQGFALNDATGLAVTGTVTAASIGLQTSTGGLALSGVLDAGAGVVSLSSVGGVLQTGGSIAARSLASDHGVTGDVVLGEAANAIGTLGGFTVTAGSLALTDGGALTVGGVVKVDDGRTIALTADAIAFAGAGSLDAGGGVVALVPLSGAAVLTLDGTTTGDLGRITAGTISLGGAAGGGGTQAAGIAITGNLTTAAVLELHSTGTIVQSGGRLSVGSLTGNASGVSIEQPGNVIPLLGAFTVSGGDFRLADSVGLTVRGSVTGAGTVALTTAGALALAGDIAAGTLDLNSTAGITQNSGSLTAGTLLSSLGVTGNVTLNSAGNAITNLGGFAVRGGGFGLHDAVALTVTGPVRANSVALIDSATGAALTVSGSVAGSTAVTLAATAGTLGLSGTIDAGTGTLDLSSAGAIIQAGGALTAGVLQSSLGVTGDVTLGAAANALGALGAFPVTGGSFALTDGVSVSVAGVVAVESGRTITLRTDGFGFGAGALHAPGGTVSLIPLSGTTAVTLGGAAGGIAAGDLSRITAGTISLGGAADGGGTQAARIDLIGNATTAAVLALHTTGMIRQSAGTLSVGSLVGEAYGIAIEQRGNVIPVLGAFTVNGGDFRLADSVALDVTGTLRAANVILTDSATGTALTVSGAVIGTGTVGLTATAGALALSGDVTAGTLDLNAANGISQDGGSLVAGTLLSSRGVVGDVVLTRPTNAITRLGGFAVSGGDFTLADGAALDVTGALRATNVTLTESGAALTVSGSIFGTGMVGLTAAGALALNGAVTAGTLDLNAASGISQGGGALVAGMLLSSAGVTGDVTLGSATNAIARLAGFTVSGGDFTLADGAALDVTGALHATNVTLTDSGAALTVSGSVAATDAVGLTATAGGLSLSGAVTAATLDLNAARGLTQGGGVLTTGTLLSSLGVTGDVVLGSATNAIARLGGFTVSGGDFTLADGVALDVTGALRATNVMLTDRGTALTVSGVVVGSGTVGLTATAGALALNGTVTAGTLDLNAAGGISQGGGSLTADTLLSSLGVAGDVALTRTTNAIASLGGFTVSGGDFTLIDRVALDVTGTLSAANVALTESDAALTVSGAVSGTGTVALTAGVLALNGAVSAGTLDLNAARGISQSGGALVADSLLSSLGVTGDVALTRGGNQIARLGGFTVSGGDFTLTDAVALDVTGALSATNVTLTDHASGTALTVSGSVAGADRVALTATAGALALNGAVTAGTLDLNATLGIVQGGGSLAADTLLSSLGVTGPVALTSDGNRVARLGGFTVTGGDFNLHDAVALDVAGVLNVANMALTDSAPGTALTVTGRVISTGTVALTATAGALALSADVTARTLDLNAANGISQSGGALAADTLLSSLGVTGDVALTRTTNAIASLGDFAVSGGDFTLLDRVALDVTGALSAANVVLMDSGAALTVSGAVSGTGTVALTAGALALNGAVTAATLDLNAARGISQGSGSVAADTLLSSLGVTGDVALTSGGNQVARLGGFVVTGGDFSLMDSVVLDVIGTVRATNVALTDSASGTALVVNGAIAATGTVALTTTAGALVLNGVVSAATLEFGAAGGIVQNGGSLAAGNLLSRAGVTGDVSLTRATNAIARLGDFTTTGTFTLVDRLALDVTGALRAANVALTANGAALTVSGAVSGTDTVKLTAASGRLALNGAVSAGVLDLNAVGGIRQGGGAVTADTLLSSLGVTGNVVLTSSGNQIATLNAFRVTGGNLALTDARALTIASGGAIPAQVAADNITLAMLGAGASGDVAISGAVVVPGTLSVTTNGSITRSGGGFVVGMLTGSAVTLADFGTGANVGTLGQFTVSGGALALGNAQPLTITGPLSADFLRITATGSMTLAGDITTLGETRAEQGLATIRYAGSAEALNNPLPARGSYLAVLADGNAPASFTQAIPVTIRTAGGAISTLRIQLLSNGGTITLGDLTAPTTDLLLFPGGNGDVVGNGLVHLYGLLVAGRGGNSDLSGTIGALDGEAAAHLAEIAPIPDASYRFNACPIGSVNCVLTPVNLLPSVNPLNNFVLDEVRGDEDDLDMILPNVAAEDY